MKNTLQLWQDSDEVRLVLQIKQLSLNLKIEKKQQFIDSVRRAQVSKCKCKS